MATYSHACPTAGCDWQWVFIVPPPKAVDVRCPRCKQVTTVDPNTKTAEPAPDAVEAPQDNGSPTTRKPSTKRKGD